VIAPKEFEDWIKIYDKINTIASPLPLKRKKSILSTVTYSAEVEDNSNSSGGSSEDDITPPTTPTNEPIFIILSGKRITSIICAIVMHEINVLFM
jgi:hypothetical protein